ncbi:MAG: hemerythrin family protein [Rhodocyclaceae bacterium]|nr:hemerythrin family protein [Rhodocyclaceae bacterium]MCP5234809.1 hemerythrin family protein [Zoogloeaceae bacterium]
MIKRRLDPDKLFSVGDPELDRQHRELLKLGQRAVSELGERLDREAHKLLDELVRTIEHHFAAEERKLAAVGYPDLEHHRELHFEVREKLAELLLDATSGKCAPVDIAQFVLDWVENHVVTADKPFSNYLSSAKRAD